MKTLSDKVLATECNEFEPTATKPYCTRYSDGIEFWQNDKKQLHRLDGPAFTGAGHETWYCNGVFHREDGPAVVVENGYTGWYQKGQAHRIDGPALEYASGSVSYYIRGKRYRSKELFDRAIQLKLY